MNFFDQKTNVEKYIEMTKDYNGAEFIGKLKPYLEENATLLELGMGPGKDLDQLKDIFEVTGSDYSQVFLDLYHEKHPEIPLVRLDAVTLEVDSSFDCLYSNKVLHHLPKEDLLKSVKRQSEILKPGGIVFHSFWRGEGSESFDGLLFTYYLEDELKTIYAEDFELLLVEVYMEESEEDSILIIGKKKSLMV